MSTFLIQNLTTARKKKRAIWYFGAKIFRVLYRVYILYKLKHFLGKGSI